MPERARILEYCLSDRFLPLLLLAALVAFALLGPVLWPASALAQHVELRLQQPSLAHPLGTDRFGRDLLARLLLGARWSIAGAFVVCAGTTLTGLLVAIACVLAGGAVDAAMSRLAEALMALPGLVAALALTAVLGPSFKDLLLAMILTGWPAYARIYRSLIRGERAAPYVEGAVAAGAGPIRVMVRHVLPNALGAATVLATSNFGYAVLNLAALSFLGLGMQPPTPEWGVMINDARAYFEVAPWQMFAPGLCIICTVLAVNLAGDSVRDALDPRARRSRSTAPARQLKRASPVSGKG